MKNSFFFFSFFVSVQNYTAILSLVLYRCQKLENIASSISIASLLYLYLQHWCRKSVQPNILYQDKNQTDAPQSTNPPKKEKRNCKLESFFKLNFTPLYYIETWQLKETFLFFLMKNKITINCMKIVLIKHIIN